MKGKCVHYKGIGMVIYSQGTGRDKDEGAKKKLKVKMLDPVKKETNDLPMVRFPKG
jgi:hypothetical protein